MRVYISGIACVYHVMRDEYDPEQGCTEIWPYRRLHSSLWAIMSFHYKINSMIKSDWINVWLYFYFQLYRGIQWSREKMFDHVLGPLKVDINSYDILYYWRINENFSITNIKSINVNYKILCLISLVLI